MAQRFWVGSTGSWDSATTHWSATTGGAGGASEPAGGVDDAIFDGASNATAYAVTVVSGVAAVKDLSFAAPASGNLTFAGSTDMAIFGSITAYAGLIRTYTGVFNLFATSSKTITSAGVGFTNINCNGAGGTWVLQDAYASPTGVLNVLAGTLDTNNQAVTVQNFQPGVPGFTTTRAVSLGSSVISCSTWNAITTAGLTVNAGTSVMTVSGITFNGGGFSYNQVNLTSTATVAMTGKNRFATFQRTAASGPAVLTLGADIVITGTFTATGANATSQRLTIRSSEPGVRRTITAGAVALTNVDFIDVVFAGAANWGGSSVTSQFTRRPSYSAISRRRRGR